MIDAALVLLALALIVLFVTERRRRWEESQHRVRQLVMHECEARHNAWLDANGRELDEEIAQFSAWLKAQVCALRLREGGIAP